MELSVQVKKFPKCPGVYFFLDKRGEPLYIGKAASLRSRILSYFRKDIILRISEMVSSAARVKFQKTDSVLEALILEANLIKKHQPKYNIREKDDKSFNYVIITKEDFPRVLVARGREVERIKRVKDSPFGNIKCSFGPFPDGNSLKSALKIIRKIFPFRDKCLPLSGKPCFNRQIKLCPGVCSGEISKDDYLKNIKNIKLFFEGKKKDVIKNLEKEMSVFAKNREFESAEIIKNKIFSLKHIQDISLIKNDKTSASAPFRIEAYDISHIAGKFTVGAMVVLEEGKPNKSEYRLFKVRSVKKPDDIASLREILSRRISHKEWPLPELIVIDGGRAQKNAAEEILKNNKINIPIVSVTKDRRHKPMKLLGLKRHIGNISKEILLANYEAHRFAIGYHKKLRSVI